MVTKQQQSRASQAPEWFVYDGTRRMPYLLVSPWHYLEGREAWDLW